MIKHCFARLCSKHVPLAATLLVVSVVILVGPASAFAEPTRAEIEKALTSTVSNMTLGSEALSPSASGKLDSAFGSQALENLTTGEDDIAVGHAALMTLTTVSKDVAVGGSALKFSTTGADDVAVGDSALLNNISGSENTAVGNIAEIKNTTGRRNTAVGREALAEGTTGEKNTGVGYNALNENQTGSENTAVGVDTLGSPTLEPFSVSQDTVLGYEAGHGVKGNGNIFIGLEAGANLESAENELYIANSRTNSPLIFGNFATKVAKINGTLEVAEAPEQPSRPGAGEISTGPSRMAARQTSFAIVGNGTKTKWTLKDFLATRLVTVSVQVGEGTAEHEEPGEVESPSNYKVKPIAPSEVEVTFNTAPVSGKEYYITISA